MKNREGSLRRARDLLRLFQEGRIPTLAEHEVHPNLDRSSRENYLYFTLPPCINFQRSSPALWRAALATWNDPETRWVFLPEEVVARDKETLRAALRKHSLALQPNKHTDIWSAIATTLHELFDDDPRELLRACDFDVARILKLIQQDKRERFTHLRGPKMANYWLYILTQYTDANFSRMDEISIIPDTHVLQCSIRLGLATEKFSSVQVAQAWRELLSGSGIAPVQMHPVLWNWSRNGFQPEA